MRSLGGLLLVLAAAGCASSQPARPAQPPPTSQVRTTSAALTVARAAPETRPAQPAPVAMRAATPGPRDDVEAAGPTDAALSGKIRRALAEDNHLRELPVDRVQIRVAGSDVTLTGELPSVADKVAVEQRAREVDGVLSVHNDIRVVR